MPGRLVTALIVLFWLGIGAWFVVRDAWPRLDPDEPPRLMVDLVEEGGGVQRSLRSTGMLWFINPDSTVLYTVETMTIYAPDSDTFVLLAEYKQPGEIHMSSRYTMDRDGNISRFEIVVKHLKEKPTAKGKESVTERQDTFTFEIHSRRPTLTHVIEKDAVRQETSHDFPDVRLPHTGLIQTPYHPVYRLERVLPGRTWKVPFFDPLAASDGRAEPTLVWLDARARHERETLQVTRDLKKKDISCVVFDYTGEQVQGTTWQDAENGEVLKQEWTIHGAKWVVQQARDVSTPVKRAPEQRQP
jgi:hypothetical protein